VRIWCSSADGAGGAAAGRGGKAYAQQYVDVVVCDDSCSASKDGVCNDGRAAAWAPDLNPVGQKRRIDMPGARSRNLQATRKTEFLVGLPGGNKPSGQRHCADGHLGRGILSVAAK
jgi:hypothetical protein